MNPIQRGTRRARSIAILWCVLLLSAAETGGAVAPPCASATPVIMTGPSTSKPVGDPDTPDEGGHTVKTSTFTAVTSPAGSSANGSHSDLRESRSPFAWLAQWIRSFTGFFHQG